ncbi:hypothetical protein PIB30_034953 [Stylosanthes scabra]|uniref:DUF4283 domain-containing protein n=1 Tax=Stylosanthes scabra TaxID=79078 RepID=A0ABU6XB18_9FABA|nr:hypothetical protein [Stylosanthes scabra]
MAREEEQGANLSNETVDEENLSVYDEEDITEGIQDCKTRIIGKLITNKNINLHWIQTAMTNMWRNPEGFRAVEVKPKIYKFFFAKEADMERALKGSPSLFRNAWMIMKKWGRGGEALEEGLDKANVKMQIWGLAEHCKTPKLGEKIVAYMGEVLDCEVYKSNRGQVPEGQNEGRNPFQKRAKHRQQRGWAHMG